VEVCILLDLIASRIVGLFVCVFLFGLECLLLLLL